ncbi:MAG: hypothetical protein K2N35_17765 [Muribaculaceae bacterium]|nr:hypothetical protein [Muribaculaceae bacterium]
MDKSELFRDNYSESDFKVEEKDTFTTEDVMAAIHGGIEEADKRFDEKDYDGALPGLIDMYEILKARKFYLIIEKEIGFEEYMNLLAWTCFRICFCYVENEDYPRAYFYIEQVRGHDSDCFMEWINVLVNSERVDALGIVEYYAKDPSKVSDIFNEELEFKKVMSFLERRLGYLYIQTEQYDEAREIFTRLLDDPASSDFAREELEYLDSLCACEK